MLYGLLLLQNCTDYLQTLNLNAEGSQVTWALNFMLVGSCAYVRFLEPPKTVR